MQNKNRKKEGKRKTVCRNRRSIYVTCLMRNNSNSISISTHLELFLLPAYRIWPQSHLRKKWRLQSLDCKARLDSRSSESRTKTKTKNPRPKH